MTETEAKTKWCPMVRHVTYSGESEGGFNRATHIDAGVNLNCVGSACMMWRVSPFDKQYVDGVMVTVQCGYCGLVGKL